MILLKKYLTKHFTLSNRIVMAPMTRSRSDRDNSIATDLMSSYYEQRASAGLIISEGISISKEAVGYINVPGIYTAEQTASWKKVTDKVHKKGGLIFGQLWHVGRILHPDLLDGALPLAPSALNPVSKSYTFSGFKDTVTPEKMSLEQIQQTISDYKNAGVNAINAGFDGVEIHAANGYLLHQFFAKCSNIRNDDYGGSIENRARILFDIIDSMQSVIPISKIGVRLSPDFKTWFGITTDDETTKIFEYIVNKLNQYDIAYLHIGGYVEADDPTPHDTIMKTALNYRKKFTGTYIINRGFTKELATRAIETGVADLISFGEPFISNPDLVERFKDNQPLQQADRDTYYTAGEKGYTDYPVYKK